MKKKLIMALAVTSLSLTAGLGTHFGLSSSSNSHSSPDTTKVNSLRNTSGKVSYEFDVLNFKATFTPTTKFGVESLDSKGNVIKNYGNFQLKNSAKITKSYRNYEFDYNPGNLNAQQLIKLDNLSSSGTVIRIYDVNNFDAKTSPTQYSDIDINLSVKNATAYDNVNHAFYVGIVTASHPRKHEWFSFNPNTADVAKTLDVFTEGADSGQFEGLFKVQAYSDGKSHNLYPNASKDDWASAHVGGAKMVGGNAVANVLTYETPYSFTMLRTYKVQFDQGALNVQFDRYYFFATKVNIYNVDNNLDQAVNGKSSSNDEKNSVAQVVDMTTLGKSAKTVDFFNGRLYFLYCGFAQSMQVDKAFIYTSPVLFNTK